MGIHRNTILLIIAQQAFFPNPLNRCTTDGLGVMKHAAAAGGIRGDRPMGEIPLQWVVIPCSTCLIAVSDNCLHSKRHLGGKKSQSVSRDLDDSSSRCSRAEEQAQRNMDATHLSTLGVTLQANPMIPQSTAAFIFVTQRSRRRGFGV